MSLKRYEGKIAGSYDLEETIGKGHFAVVKLARHVYSGEKVAVKVIDKNKLDEVSKAHLFQEVGCMKLVQHPNVVRLYEVIDTPSKLYLIMELGDGGDMWDFISRHSQGLEEETARRYFRQVTHAINYCHQLHVVHRDLKLENVVIFEKLGIVKLTDFGFSNKFIPGSKLETSCGSLAYSAPEILLGDSYDAPAVDVWSLGVILYMLVCGELPFQEANDSETLTKIMDCAYHLPPHVSDECRDLISLMLVREPRKRLILSSLLTHSWLTRGDPAPLPLLPLITWEHLTQEEHALIISKMVARKMASKEEILAALEQNAYNHITATYYLLAESRLRKQRERSSGGPTGGRGSRGGSQRAAPGLAINAGSTDPKAKLAPLALSPRLPAVHSSPDSPDSASTPPGGRPAGTVAPPPPRRTTRSPADRKLLLSRKCSLIAEEAVEEDGEPRDGTGPPTQTPEPPPTTTARQMALRPLHSVRSSPQLLQIHEEEGSEEDEADILLPLTPAPGPPRHKRLSPTPRGGSSSDTSDTDDADPRRRRHRHHRADHRLTRGRLQRRDSSENSSDTDGGGRAAGAGGARLWTGAGQSRPSSGNSDNKRGHGGGGSGGKGGRQNKNSSADNGSPQNAAQNNGTPQNAAQNSLLGKRDSSSDRDNSQTEIGCKMSNISISSNQQAAGRGHKYVSDDDEGPAAREAALNEENKAKTSRMIHVRSKNFSDLMERFSASKHGAVDEPGTLFTDQPAPKVRHRNNNNNMSRNNGLLARSPDPGGEAGTTLASGTVRTKCCSVV